MAKTLNLNSGKTKRATNISLSVDVYNEAKALGINLSQTCERFLQQAIKEERARRWEEENAQFIKAYNKTLEAEGFTLAEWCSF